MWLGLKVIMKYDTCDILWGFSNHTEVDGLERLCSSSVIIFEFFFIIDRISPEEVDKAGNVMDRSNEMNCST